MYRISSKMLKHFVLVAFVAALALSMTRSHQASGKVDFRRGDQLGAMALAGTAALPNEKYHTKMC